MKSRRAFLCRDVPPLSEGPRRKLDAAMQRLDLALNIASAVIIQQSDSLRKARNGAKGGMVSGNFPSDGDLGKPLPIHLRSHSGLCLGLPLSADFFPQLFVSLTP
jgi:hypothetical protein